MGSTPHSGEIYHISVRMDSVLQGMALPKFYGVSRPAYEAAHRR